MIARLSSTHDTNNKVKYPVFSSNAAVKSGGKIINTFENNLKSKTKLYTDCFIKHSAQSAPVLAGLSALLFIFDKERRNASASTSVSREIMKFFLPVMIISSAILTYIENKNSTEL